MGGLHQNTNSTFLFNAVVNAEDSMTWFLCDRCIDVEAKHKRCNTVYLLHKKVGTGVSALRPVEYCLFLGKIQYQQATSTNSTKYFVQHNIDRG